MAKDDLTKRDLEKTLEAHAKAIELQILISQQQNKLLEQLDYCREKIKEIDAHFTNGFRSELKEHTHQEVLVIKEILDGLVAKLEKKEDRADERCGECTETFSKGIDAHNTQIRETLQSILEISKEIQTQLEEVDRRSWQQMWVWGSIALFTLVNAVILVVGLWQNAWIIRS